MHFKLSVKVISPSSYSETYLFYPKKIIKKEMKHGWVIDRRTLKAKYYHVKGLKKGYFVRLSPNRYVLEQELEKFLQLSGQH
jgi:hypothetical protein